MNRSHMRACIAAAAGALLLYVLLVLPASPRDLSDAALTFPLEWVVLVSGLVVVPPHWRVGAALSACITFALMLIVLLKIGDFAMLSALNRPFSPVVDMFLIRAGFDVVSGSIGPVAAWIAASLGFVVFCTLTFAVYLALRRITRHPLSPRARLATGTVFAGAVILALADYGKARGIWSIPVEPPGSASNAVLAAAQITRGRDALSELRLFRTAAARDPYKGQSALFDRTGGRDIVVIYIESYGKTSFDNPLYAPTHVATLGRAEAELSGAGYAMRSGWLNSPTAGGQSWLAHGTLGSGLRTTDQGRYGAMLASGRQSLFHLAQASGFRTAAVMPAITLAWPEGLTMGFDTILAADDLGYAGLPFNWVTMPDQYTLSAYAALLPPDPRPDFLQIALISSHAPWVPVPRMIDWADVGDGTVFNEIAASGDTPAAVWRDRDRVRDQYRLAVDYSLKAATAYAARRDDLPLFVILGDHQPAGFIAGSDSRDVAVHLIGPPDLIAQADGWEWQDGMVPQADTPVWPMEDFRDRFIRAYSTLSRMADAS